MIIYFIWFIKCEKQENSDEQYAQVQEYKFINLNLEKPTGQGKRFGMKLR